jgi:protein-S-isoprenylcysteine O-methyltransferase Ste14
MSVDATFLKAALAFVALPGTVAFLVPLTLFLPPAPIALDPLRLSLLLVGIVLLLSAVREFCVVGRGTLAPWAPPTDLVTSGLYGFSRNPMYVAVVLILLGWAALFHSWTLLVYALAIAGGFHLRVVFGEEPWLEQVHGDDWVRYRANVPRWFV